MTDVLQSHSSRSYLWVLFASPASVPRDLPLLLIRPVQHTVAQLSSLLGTRDVEGWQLPIDRRVSHDLLSGLLTSHRWFRLLVPISSLPSFVGIVIITITVTTSLLASGTACTTCTWAAALLCTAPVTSTSTAASCWLLSRLAPAGASCTTRGLPGYSGPVCQLNAFLFRGVFVAVDFGHWNLLSMLFLEVGDELPHLVGAPTSLGKGLLQGTSKPVVDKERREGLSRGHMSRAGRQSQVYLLLHACWCCSSLRRWGSSSEEYSTTTFLSGFPGGGFFVGAFFPLPMASGFPPVSFRAVCFVRAIKQGDLHLTFVQ